MYENSAKMVPELLPQDFKLLNVTCSDIENKFEGFVLGGDGLTLMRPAFHKQFICQELEIPQLQNNFTAACGSA